PRNERNTVARIHRAQRLLRLNGCNGAPCTRTQVGFGLLIRNTDNTLTGEQGRAAIGERCKRAGDVILDLGKLLGAQRTERAIGSKNLSLWKQQVYFTGLAKT